MVGTMSVCWRRIKGEEEEEGEGIKMRVLWVRKKKKKQHWYAYVAGRKRKEFLRQGVKFDILYARTYVRNVCVHSMR